MGKTGKIILYIAAGAAGVIIFFLLLDSYSHRRIISSIPEIPDPTTLSPPVRIQLFFALEKTRHDPSSGNLGMLGMVYHSSANYEQAAQCYKLASGKDRSDWTWNYYLGYLKMEMGESDAVIENFKKVIRKNPDASLAWYYIGSEYRNLRNNELAEEAFGKIINPGKEIPQIKGSARKDHFPLSAYAGFQLSRIYTETGRNDLAEKTLKEIINNNRSFGPAYRLLGNMYSTMGDTVQAKRYSLRAGDLLDFSPPVDTLTDRLALLSRSELFLLKKIDEAERSIYPEWNLKLINHAIEYIPDNKYLISKVINTCLWMNLDEQAEKFTDQHISLFKESFIELNNTGILFLLNGLYPPAMKYFTNALSLQPGNTGVEANLALCCRNTGDKQKARSVLNDMLLQNKDNPDVIAEVANTLFFNFRENEQAAVYLAKLKQLAPSNPKVQKLAAGVAEKNGKYAEAITLYELSFTGNPEDLTTIKYLGNLLTGQEMWDKAIKHYRKALEYHPNDPDLLEKLGTLLVRCPDWSLRNIEEGKEYSERAFIHISSRPNTLVSAGKSLAFACAMLGDKKNAIATIQETISIARIEKLPAAEQAELENLNKTFRSMQD